MADPSLGRPAPGAEKCPPGYKPIAAYPGMPAGASPCGPVGPGVPAGGWKPLRPGTGPGYAPTGEAALRALNSIPGALGGVEEDQGDVSQYLGGYADWLRTMAR